jgi:flagellar basal body rod protein FlgG
MTIRSEGLRAAAQALRYWERRQEIMANNLANVSTHGFKGQHVFARLLADVGVVPEAATDLRPGLLTPTGQPLDLALDGDGFFVVETGQGERLIRGGSMVIDGSGQIVTANGDPLLGDKGPIVLSTFGGDVEISREGTVVQDGHVLGRLRVVRMGVGAAFEHEAGVRFQSEATEPVAITERVVRQGFLEESNVGTVTAMVDMIDIQRSYRAVQNSLSVMDGVLETITNRIGRVD